VTAPARTWRTTALRALNVLLEPAGLAVRTLAEEQAALADIGRIVDGYFDAAERARHEATQAQRGFKRIRRHLVELDALVVGRSPELRAARRVLDVALGRDVEPVA
jgi:hypothetical protein